MDGGAAYLADQLSGPGKGEPGDQEDDPYRYWNQRQVAAGELRKGRVALNPADTGLAEVESESDGNAG